MGRVLARSRPLGGRMSKFKRGLVFATRYIRTLRGGSQPMLIEATDGFFYVVKFNNNIQGANVPFNEAAGSTLYRALGLQGPAWRPIFVSDLFLDQNPQCWIRTVEGPLLRPATGLTFGSRFLGGGSTRLLGILPENSFSRVTNRDSFWLAWLIDVCAHHTDDRQAVFMEGATGCLEAYFVDHGHLFGGPNGGGQKPFLGLRYLDPRIYQDVSSSYLQDLLEAPGTLNVDLLWRRIQDLPDHWKTASALCCFAKCLDTLSDTKSLQGIADKLIDAFVLSNGFEHDLPQRGCKTPVRVLRLGVQATGFGPCPVSRGADRRACA